MDASDPLPEGDTFTLYRGVWGAGGEEARGIAWTLSLKVAQSFAGHFRTGVGEVYTTEVKRSDVFAYINESGRGEQEVLVVLPDSHPVAKLKSQAATEPTKLLPKSTLER